MRRIHTGLQAKQLTDKSPFRLCWRPTTPRLRAGDSFRQRLPYGMDPLTRLLHRAAASAHHGVSDALAQLLTKALGPPPTTPASAAYLQLLAMADVMRLLSAVRA